MHEGENTINGTLGWHVRHARRLGAALYATPRRTARFPYSSRTATGESHRDFIYCLVFWRQDFFEVESNKHR